MLAPVIEWFNALASREKLLVAAAAVLTMFAVLVIGVVRPIAAGRAHAAAALEDKRTVLADLERVAARFGPNAGAGAGAAVGQPSGESLVVLIDRTARSGGLGPYLKRNEPDNANGIRLRFENVPFDELVTWLAQLQSTQSVGVSAATIDPGKDVGRVNANLQLARAAR